MSLDETESDQQSDSNLDSISSTSQQSSSDICSSLGEDDQEGILDCSQSKSDSEHVDSENDSSSKNGEDGSISSDTDEADPDGDAHSGVWPASFNGFVEEVERQEVVDLTQKIKFYPHRRRRSASYAAKFEESRQDTEMSEEPTCVHGAYSPKTKEQATLAKPTNAPAVTIDISDL